MALQVPKWHISLFLTLYRNSFDVWAKIFKQNANLMEVTPKT